MNEKKSNKKLLIIVAVITIIISLVLGFIAGYNCDNDNKKEDTDEEISSESIDSNIINDIKNFPTTNDSSVKVYKSISSYLTEEEMKTNFTDITKKVDNLEFKFSCAEYYEEENKCEIIATSIIVNVNNSTFTIKLDEYDPNYQEYLLNKTDQYLIISSYDGGGVDNMSVLIYDLSGNIKYKNNNLVATYSSVDEQEESFAVEPKIVNNILYMVLVDKENTGSDNTNYSKLKFSYVNLNDPELKDTLIQKFNALISYENN